jgi:hypothetical protein
VRSVLTGVLVMMVGTRKKKREEKNKEKEASVRWARE